MVGFFVWKASRDLPDYESLAKYEPPVMTRIHAHDGSLMAEYARERRIFVPINVMPKLVIAAFLSAEDKRFYEHGGLDFTGIGRAVLNNLQNCGKKRPEGASTITQQVAKNFLLSSEQKLERKLKEAILAIRIERAYSKDKILELYLNEIYLGMGSYGVAAAALNYFSKELSELTIEEAAYLAALPKAPNNYHPFRKAAEATIRRDWIIDQMAEVGYITAAQAKAAKAKPLKVNIRPFGTQIYAADYFAEDVRRRLVDSSARTASTAAPSAPHRRRPRQRRPVGAHHARSQPAAHGAQGADRRPRGLRPREGLARAGAEDRHRRRLGRGAGRHRGSGRPGSRGASASCSRRSAPRRWSACARRASPTAASWRSARRSRSPSTR